MAESRWLRHAVRVGRFEFRRSVREMRTATVRLAFMALVLLVPTAGILFLGIAFADAIRQAEPIPLPQGARGSVAMFWLFAVFIVGQRVASARPRIEADAFVLTAVSARTAATGLALAETLRLLAYVAPPVVAVTGVAGYALGPTAALVTVPLAAAGFAATAVVTGSLAGYVVVWLVESIPFVARHKTKLGTVLAVIAMGGFFLLQFPEVAGFDQSALAWLPVAWFADLAVVGTPVDGSAARVAAAAGVSVALLGGGLAAIERVTTAVWYAEAVDPDSGGPSAAADHPTGGAEALAAAIAPLRIPAVVSPPTRRVAQWVLLRTRRDPRRITFLLIPLVFLGNVVVTAGAGAASLPAVLSPLLAVVLSWLAGALFAVNPLGDEGAVLPMTLVAVSGERYVRGLVLPGLLVVGPVALVATTAAAIVAPYSALQVVGLVAVTAFVTTISVLLAPAVGMAFPRFSAISVGQSRAVLPPSFLAVAIHGVATVLPGSILVLLVVDPELARLVVAGAVGYLPALVLGLLDALVGGLGGVATAFERLGDAVDAVGVLAVRLGGGGLLIGAGAASAASAYRRAVRRFDRFEPL